VLGKELLRVKCKLDVLREALEDQLLFVSEIFAINAKNLLTPSVSPMWLLAFNSIKSYFYLATSAIGTGSVIDLSPSMILSFAKNISYST
jgi:hypothetical protein